MAEPQPKVTVAICTYNAGDYLAESIASALSQTLTDIEVLVLDNASTDHTAEVVKQFGDPRFRYIRNESNLGFVGNVNKGLELARGEFVTFLGADDLWEHDYLRQAIELFEKHPSASMVHSVVSLIDSSGRRYGYAHEGWASITPGREAFLGCFVHGFTIAAVIVRTSHLRQLGGFNTAWGNIADTWLFLTMCLEGDVLCVTEPLVRYRVHDQSISMSMYRSGEMVRQQLATAREALSWPKAIQRGVTRYRGKILRQIAFEAIRMTHLCRLTETRQIFLKLYFQIIREVPSVMLFPSTWLRLGLGLLPRSIIQQLRQKRRATALQHHSAPHSLGATV